jgi:hypothetical protein
VPLGTDVNVPLGTDVDVYVRVKTEERTRK